MPNTLKTHRPRMLKSRAHNERPSPVHRGRNAHWRRLWKWYLQQHP